MHLSEHQPRKAFKRNDFGLNIVAGLRRSDSGGCRIDFRSGENVAATNWLIRRPAIAAGMLLHLDRARVTATAVGVKATCSGVTVMWRRYVRASFGFRTTGKRPKRVVFLWPTTRTATESCRSKSGWR